MTVRSGERSEGRLGDLLVNKSVCCPGLEGSQLQRCTWRVSVGGLRGTSVHRILSRGSGGADGSWFKVEFPCMLRLSGERLMAGSRICSSGATQWSHVARPNINHSRKVTRTIWWLKCCCRYSPNIDFSPCSSLKSWSVEYKWPNYGSAERN